MYQLSTTGEFSQLTVIDVFELTYMGQRVRHRYLFRRPPNIENVDRQTHFYKHLYYATQTERQTHFTDKNKSTSNISFK